MYVFLLPKFCLDRFRDCLNLSWISGCFLVHEAGCYSTDTVTPNTLPFLNTGSENNCIYPLFLLVKTPGHTPDIYNMELCFYWSSILQACITSPILLSPPDALTILLFCSNVYQVTESFEFDKF